MDKRKKVIKTSVRESVKKLINQARKSYKAGKKAQAKRYVKMALDLMKKNKVRLPPELKNSFCKKCCTIWIPEKTLMVYYDSKNDCLRIKCECGHTKRI